MLTLRANSGADLMPKTQKVIAWLIEQEATPGRPQPNGHGPQPSAPAPAPKPAQPQPQPAASAPAEQHTYEVIPVNTVAHVVSEKGHHSLKVKGGKYSKFGVTAWTEVIPVEGWETWDIGAEYAPPAGMQFATVADISKVLVHIVQPRLASFESEEVTVHELSMWEDLVRGVAKRILAGPAGLVATPGESQCKFCRAKGSCPALRDHALAVVRVDDFTDLDARIALLTNDDLAFIGPRLELIHDWCNGVRAEMERRLLSGQEITGWKVVQGKKGNRAWNDQQEAENWLVPLLGDRAFVKKLVSPTQAEQLLKKDFIKPRASLVTQSEGKPAVVPITDKRPVLSLSCDFQPVEEE
jgi:hypothetical protein